MEKGSTPGGSAMIDWATAVKIGGRVAGEGPAVSNAEAQDTVAELRDGASRSTGLVRNFTGLVAEAGTAPVLVVDRAGWVQANADSFGTLVEPLVGKLTDKRGAPTGVARTVGTKVTGAEIGLLLGFLGSKVLGQFDPFHVTPTDRGRLLLVAPNIVHVERELEVIPGDFRLWVCLHEETHRVQFTAVPWLGDHLRSQIQQLIDTVEPNSLPQDFVQRLGEVVRGGKGNIMELMSSPAQREIMDRVTGVMSLLEGHADVVMDGVGPEVIPSVAEIRRRFNRRRKGIGVLDKLLRRMLGLDAKMAQYRDGAAFVRTVVDKVGMADFNAVFAGPDNLPSKAEIHDPGAWVDRVLAV